MNTRIAIITGASSGIGKATALRLAKLGVRIILNARNIDKLVEVKNLVNKITDSQNAEIVCGDVNNPETIDLCIKESIKLWNQLPSIFIASAGRGLPGTVLTSDVSEWNNLVNTNITGLMHQMRSISSMMVAEVSHTQNFVEHPYDIVIIGSSVGRNVSPFNSVYGATKFAVHGLTEALRRDLGPKGIRVTLVEPGLVNTNFQREAGYNLEWFEQYSQDVGPILVGDDIAQVIAFLLSLPGNVHLDNISIRPTRQAYP